MPDHIFEDTDGFEFVDNEQYQWYKAMLELAGGRRIFTLDTAVRTFQLQSLVIVFILDTAVRSFLMDSRTRIFTLDTETRVFKID